MSTAVMTRAGDFDGFDELAEFAALVESYNRDDLEPDRNLRTKLHQPGRKVAKQRAIEMSEREGL